MTISVTANAATSQQRLRDLARRYPVGVYLALVFAVVWPVLGIPLLFGYSLPAGWLEAALSALAFVVLFGGAVAITAAADGRGGVHALLRGLVRWRTGVGLWVAVVGALPALTLMVALVTGTLQRPDQGWARMGVGYLSAVVLGTVLVNLWEEAAWAGFVQKRLMERHGLLVGSLLTAVPFALIHVPGTFQNTAPGEALGALVAVALVAPFFRYLAGAVLLASGGSVLAVGVFHASLNAVGTLSAAEGGWQVLPAMLILVVAVAGGQVAGRRRITRARR